MSIIPMLKAREVLQLLLRLGFKVVSQKGSHIKLRHPLNRTKQVTLPFHNKDLSRGLLFSILKQAKIPVKEFLKILSRN